MGVLVGTGDGAGVGVELVGRFVGEAVGTPVGASVGEGVSHLEDTVHILLKQSEPILQTWQQHMIQW